MNESVLGQKRTEKLLFPRLGETDLAVYGTSETPRFRAERGLSSFMHKLYSFAPYRDLQLRSTFPTIIRGAGSPVKRQETIMARPFSSNDCRLTSTGCLVQRALREKRRK
ncbi:hypothetical protein HZH66_003001 [Vespula vulgaris]|uniref:Uncharacterized protein n=2 Tax=Vespula TaxID=7451 RepID=A0A834UF69_VESPE|nr:hypothetical protein HZH66_003001 [Vespula vulgaris]KAF7435488.1 hypothetical protein H0235_003679 [Vespula pensylvanica]